MAFSPAWAGQDPAPEQIEAEFPAWRVWQGVSDLWYAARGRSSPAVVLREENTTELRAAVASWERMHNPQYQAALHAAEQESWEGPGVDVNTMIEAADERRRPRAW